jgi:hypothetical protein
MRNLIVVTAVVMSLSGGYAQDNGFFSNPERYTTANLEKAQQNYAAALANENEGLVEAGIAQVAMLGIMRPDCVCNKLKDSVKDLVSSGTTTAIRYRAYLVTMVLEHPSMFADEANRRFVSADELFAEIGERLTRELIAGNTDNIN